MKIIRAGYTQIFNMKKLHAREEHCSNLLSLSLSFPESPGMILRMNTNHVEWSIRARLAVDSAQWDLGIREALENTL